MKNSIVFFIRDNSVLIVNSLPEYFGTYGREVPKEEWMSPRKVAEEIVEDTPFIVRPRDIEKVSVVYTTEGKNIISTTHVYLVVVKRWIGGVVCVDGIPGFNWYPFDELPFEKLSFSGKRLLPLFLKKDHKVIGEIKLLSPNQNPSVEVLTRSVSKISDF